jgi:hypothetical protein
MPQTFDIRFDRVTGLSMLFDSPRNSFGWRGGGLLSVDAEGISVAVKRGVLSLLSRHRSQRIPAGSIREVYREGEALRVEFATGDNPRITLPFWAPDRATAAQIVESLPTTRTVEVEDEPGERRSAGGARRLPLLMAAAVLLIVVCGALFINFRRPVADSAVVAEVPPMMELPPLAEVPPAGMSTATSAEVVPLDERADRTSPGASAGPITPEEARLLAILAEDPVDWTPARTTEPSPAAEPEADDFVPSLPDLQLRGDEWVVRIPRTTLTYGTARELLAEFEREAADLSEGYRGERERFDRRTLDTAKFADQLDWYELRWRNLVERVLESRRFGDPGLAGLRGTLLSMVISQRAFLSGYAAGLRASDQARIDRAFEELARADALLARARLYLS